MPPSNLKAILKQYPAFHWMNYQQFRLRNTWLLKKALKNPQTVTEVRLTNYWQGLGDVLMLSAAASVLIGMFPNARVLCGLQSDSPFTEVIDHIPAFSGTCEPEIVPAFRQSEDSATLVLRADYHTPVWELHQAKKPLLEYISTSLGLPETGEVSYELGDRGEQYGKEFIQKHGDYLVFHTDSPRWKNKWPDEHWQELIKMQSKPVILVGTSESSFSDCIDLRNQLSLNELASVIKYCNQYVGLVSGPFWFTHAFQIPALIINGGIEPPILTQHDRSKHVVSDVPCSFCLSLLRDCPIGKERICMSQILPEEVSLE